MSQIDEIIIDEIKLFSIYFASLHHSFLSIDTNHNFNLQIISSTCNLFDHLSYY